VGVYYEITEYKKTILAAKYQDVFTYLAEYVSRSIRSLFPGVTEDRVFNKHLKAEYFESGDFSQCNDYTQSNSLVLRTTYRKFTEEITTTFVDNFEQSSITVIDWNEGEIEERRIYTDVFENYEVDDVESFFADVSTQHSVTNIETGQEYTVSFDPELPFSRPANLTWDTNTWGIDNIPVQYDSLQVIWEDNLVIYTTNAFETVISIRIPNRFSLYNDYGKTSRTQVEDDGWAEFEVKGVLITPPDGQVYYTSDVESFVGGTAKTEGSYLYIDSDLNGYYETIYVITYYRTNRLGIPVYNVMSIGFNNDGIHDFAPYEKVYKTEESISDFDNLASESIQFGTDWIYNFDKLQACDLLWEEDSILEKHDLKPKDTLFEVYKLVKESEQNSQFSELFYEIRHKTYDNAWIAYRKQLVADIAEQVFMSVTASIISATVEALITAGTFGFGWITGVAHAAGVLAYMGAYTLMTKFSIDMKLHEAESQSRSQTFSPASSDQYEPTSLNDRSIADRVLKDSMAAALVGHPGGYYSTVSGGVPGDMYTGEVLVSPPNYARMLGAIDIRGLLALLWENFLDMGDSDPDSFTALDFNGLNLDFLLLTSELQSYNKQPNYIYKNTENMFHPYSQNYANTLGFLEMKVKKKSNNQFDTIIPTNIDGRPEYQFINSTTHSLTLPLSVLYKPIVLSEERYTDIQPNPGHLVISAQCKDYNNTKGINPYNLTSLEQLAGFKAKVPISNKQFEYPIQSISIDVMKQSGLTKSYFAKDIIINESYYIVEDGALYFTKSLEEIIPESYLEFDAVLQQAWLKDLLTTTIYYNIHVLFDRFVPDTTDKVTDPKGLALAQATSYAIMDYFNQYTYAEVSANMISEIAYTETLTFWSTLISAPLAYFGSLAATAAVGKFASKAGAEKVMGLLTKQLANFGKMVTSLFKTAIYEVFDEIVKDGFIEALAENLVDLAGGTNDLGYWVSALGTSAREVGGALGQLILGTTSTKTSFKNKISLFKARITGDTKLANSVKLEIQQKLDQQKQELQQKRAKMSTWQKFFNGDTFKGIAMVASSLFFGGASFFTLLGFNTMLKGTVGIAPRVYGEAKTKAHVNEKNWLTQEFGTMNLFSGKSLEKQMKKPSEIDAGALYNLFNNLQKADTTTEVDSPPLIITFPEVNPNPKSMQRSQLTERFGEIANIESLANFEMKEDYEEIEQQTIAQGIGQNSKNQKSLERMPAWGQELLEVGEYEVLHPAKEMTIKEFLNDLNLDGLERRFGILVNGKKVDSDYTIVKPTDEIVILPNIGGNAPRVIDPRVNDIINKISDDMSSEIPYKSWKFLSEGERTYMLKFYDGLTNGLYDKDSDFDSTRDSPYLPHLKFVMDELTHLLDDLGIIEKPTYSALEKLIFPYTPSVRVTGVVGRLRIKPTRESSFTIQENTFDKWLIYAENKINDLYSSQTTIRDSSLYLVRDFFDSVYSLFGFQSKSSFYREAKLIQLRIGDVLTKAKVPGFSKNTYRELYAFIDSDWDGMYSARRDFPASIPQVQPINNLLEEVHTALRHKTDFSVSEIDDIMKDVRETASVYIEDIQNYLTSQDILTNVQNLPIKRLLEEIVHNPFSNILEKIQVRKNLAILLFGGTVDIIDRLVAQDTTYLRSLLTIKFNVEQWTINDFDNDKLRIKISDSELQDLKLSIDTIVDRWIFNNPYQQYIDEAPRRFGVIHTKEFLRSEFDVAYKIFRAFATHEKDPGISFRQIRLKAKSGQSLTKYLLSESYWNIGVKNAKKYLQVLEGFKKGTKNNAEIATYDEAITSIKDYVKDRHLGFAIQNKIGSRKYSSIFHQDWYKSTLIILSLIKYGGMNPFTMQPLDPRLFDGDVNTGLFQPHHLDALNKHLLQINEIMILDPVWHGRFNVLSRTRTGVNLQERLRDGMIELMTKKKSNIDEQDIRSAFGSLTIFNTRVSDMWINQPNFISLLADFNRRRQLIQQGKFMNFLNIDFSIWDNSGQFPSLLGNPVMEKYLPQAKETISSFLLLMDDYDFSYLFTDADIDLIKRHFKI